MQSKMLIPIALLLLYTFYTGFLNPIYFLYLAVVRVLQKVPLLFNKKHIHVEEVCLDEQRVEKEEEEDSQGPLCKIEVRGMKDTTSKDSVEFYFETKRSGGGEVEEVKGEVEDGVLLVTFFNEKSKYQEIDLKY